MFTNTKFTLNIARNVSTIDITIYGRGSTRHDATIVQTQNFASQKEIQHFKNFHKNFYCLLINFIYIRIFVKPTMSDGRLTIIKTLMH